MVKLMIVIAIASVIIEVLEGSRQGEQHKSSRETTGRSSQAEIPAWPGLWAPRISRNQQMIESPNQTKPWSAATTGAGASLRVSILLGTRQFAPGHHSQGNDGDKGQGLSNDGMV